MIYDDEGDGFELDDVLTDDTMITINSGSVDLSAAKYGYFELFKFSEDKTTVVLEETVVYHSHAATYCYCWSIDGTMPNPWDDSKAFYEVTDIIDGCGVAQETFRDDIYSTVVGNKISGNLIRQIVDQSYDYNYRDDYKIPHNLDDYDLITVCAYYETEEANGYMSYAFFTDSYVKANPVQPKPDDPKEPAEETDKITTAAPSTPEDTTAAPSTPEDTTAAPSTPEDTTTTPANPDKNENPDTGIGSVAVVTGIAVAAAGAVMILGRKRK